MGIPIDQLDDIYRIYGFKVLKHDELVRIYLYEKGRYYGADIVPIYSDDKSVKECERVKKEYSDLGYAAKTRDYKNFEDAELELYKSFFSYESTSLRITQKYEKFVEKQSKLNGGTRYEYVDSPFEINSKLSKEGTIVSSINGVLGQENPQLIIIEAAAGYGKTCTAYEILKFLINSDNCENPLLTELSRNRGAKIFRYILLDEIDREYPSLNSDLVKHEIQKGRIPLIIDGFDELLDKSDLVKSDVDEVFEEVETMLDTIGNLLIGNAKIILTTRKTAIFAGAEFDHWLRKWDDKFKVTRFSIREPRIKDWLGSKKLDVIRKAYIPVEYIANPVLLTYLRNLSDLEFEQHALEPETFVGKYFNSLLLREMERQDLIIVPDDQYQIFKNVVHMMIEFDSSAESRSFMKEIIYEQNKEKLNSALELYPSTNKPSIDNLIDKLANHALLDRKGSDDLVGFINDFVFGTFLGEIMSESTSAEIEKNFSAYMVEIGATAFRVQNNTNKEALWEKVEALKDKFESRSILNFDITLKGRILRSFTESIFQSINAYKIKFTDEHLFESCVFINCNFKDCHFDGSAFQSTSFIECNFNRCSTEGDLPLDSNGNVIIINSTQEDCQILAAHQYADEEDFNMTDIENMILSIIWKNDSKYKSQKYLKLKAQFDKRVHRYLSSVLRELEDQGLINVRGLNIYLEINKIKEIEKRVAGVEDEF